jgi:hypothetical protein
MALKGARDIYIDDITFFATAVADRGGVVTMSTVGSGEALDDANAVVAYAANPSGKLPVGMLLCDVVNYDLTRQKINPYKEEVQVGSKVTLMTDGIGVTDMIVPGATPAFNKPAYLGSSGLLTSVNTNDVATPIVGVFLSAKDENGFARVRVKLPMATPRL